MTAPRLAFLSFTAGAALACGIMAALAVRTVYTITASHHWYQLKKL